ncbi:MAG TPA: hypothetical protein VFF04_04085 [Candidatus Babeliales bacterium]|nr:hypothetical protein [Candidatus Babeliales bacterium]
MNKHIISMLMVLGLATSANAAVDWSAFAQRAALGPIPHLTGGVVAFQWGLSKLANTQVTFTIDSISKGLGKSLTQVTSDPFSWRSAGGVAMLLCAARLAYLGAKEANEERQKIGLTLQSPVTTKK